MKAATAALLLLAPVLLAGQNPVPSEHILVVVTDLDADDVDPRPEESVLRFDNEAEVASFEQGLEMYRVGSVISGMNLQANDWALVAETLLRAEQTRPGLVLSEASDVQIRALQLLARKNAPEMIAAE